MTGLDGATSVTVSGDGQTVYAVGEIGDALAVFNRDETTGRLTFVQSNQDNLNGIDGLDGVRSVATSFDGQHVYATGLFDDGLAVFGRNDQTGQLTFVEVYRDGVNDVDALGGAAFVIVSPDDQYVYVAGSTDDAIAIFERDATTGQLQFVEAQTDDLEGVTALAFSHDGQQLFAVSKVDSTLALYDRDPVTGGLSLVAREQGGAAGLDLPTSVVVSPSDDHVYVTNRRDGRVTLFDRVIQTTAFFQNGSPVSVMRDSNHFQISDIDHGTLASATVKITNLLNGGEEVLAVSTEGTNIVASFVGSELTLTGSDTVIAYQQVLQTLTYQNSATEPDPTDRVIELAASDGSDQSDPFQAIVHVNLISGPPVVDLDVDNSGGQQPNHMTSFVEGSGPVKIADGAGISDPNNVELQSAVITLTNPLDGTDESLSIDESLAAGLGIVVVGNNSDVVTMSGTATMLAYGQVFDTVAYNNLSQSPTEMDRMVTVVVNDGKFDSDPATSTVSVTANNDPPQLSFDVLRFIESQENGGGVDGLGLTVSVVVSPDGRACLCSRP